MFIGNSKKSRKRVHWGVQAQKRGKGKKKRGDRKTRFGLNVSGKGKPAKKLNRKIVGGGKNTEGVRLTKGTAVGAAWGENSEKKKEGTRELNGRKFS